MPNEAAARVDSILDDVDDHIDALDTLDEMSDQRYHDTHDTFEAASDQRKLILSWLSSWADNATWPDDRPCSVLSVGCGGGTMDRRIAGVFADHAQSLALAAVDPNPHHTEAFAERLVDYADEITVATSPFQDYTPNRRFDVIHFIHCLYYFDEIQPSLKRALDMLEPGGAMLILQAPNDDLNNLADRLWRKQWNRSAWYSDDVMEVLGTMDVEARRHRIEASVDVTRCLDPNDEQGIQILDFIAQADTRTLDPEFQASLRESLRSVASDDSGRLTVAHPVDAMVVKARVDAA